MVQAVRAKLVDGGLASPLHLHLPSASVSVSGGSHMLRIRVVSERTATADRLRAALSGALLLERQPGLDNAASPSSASSVAYADADAPLFDAVAAYLIAKKRRAYPRIPAPLLERLGRAADDDAVARELLRVLGPHLTLDPAAGGPNQTEAAGATAAGAGAAGAGGPQQHVWRASTSPADALRHFRASLPALASALRHASDEGGPASLLVDNHSQSSVPFLPAFVAAASDALVTVATTFAERLLRLVGDGGGGGGGGGIGPLVSHTPPHESAPLPPLECAAPQGAGAPTPPGRSVGQSCSHPDCYPTPTSSSPPTTTTTTSTHTWAIEADATAHLRLLYGEPDLLGMLAQGGAGSAAAASSASSASSSLFSRPASGGGGGGGGGSGRGRAARSSLIARLPPRLEPEASFVFSPDRGLLNLSPHTRDELHVAMATIEIHAASDCMGAEVSRWLMESVAGYDIAVLNAVIAATGGRGYVMAEHSADVYALSHATEVERFSSSVPAALLFKLGTLCSAVFLVFSSSALVSFVLSQTQQRMLRFTAALQRHVRARLPLVPLIISHVVDSLVFVPIMLGVLFFLFEFFSDQVLSFLILVVVWACELWSVTACRTVESVKVFPRAFGLLMTWFHAYYLSYPFGYQYLALATSCSGLLACMWHLWNRYELPALESGAISALQPRSPAVTAMLRGGLAAATAGSGPYSVLQYPGAASAAADEFGGHGGNSIIAPRPAPRPVAPGTLPAVGSDAAGSDDEDGGEGGDEEEEEGEEGEVGEGGGGGSRSAPAPLYGTPPRVQRAAASSVAASTAQAEPSLLTPLSSPSAQQQRARAATEGSALLGPRGGGGRGGAGAAASPGGSPLIEGLRALMRTTAETVTDPEGVLRQERHDRHDRLSLGGWT
jgi:hypothetical protein